MTVVDFIDLDHDEWYVQVDVIDLSSDEDSVKKDANVEDREEGDDNNIPQSENLAEAATSLPISEQDATATTSLLMEDKFVQPEKQDFLATSDGAKEGTQPGNHEFIAAADCVSEAMQSVCEAGVFWSMTEQAAATSLLLKKQDAITSSLKEDESMQSGNQVFVSAVGCAKEAIRSENTAKAAGLPSMTERGATCKSHRVGQLCQMIGCPHIVKDGLDLCISHCGGHTHGEPGSSTVPRTKSEVSNGDAGNAVGSTGICHPHAQKESEGDKEKETSRFRKFYSRKGDKQVNTSDTGYNSIVHTKGVPPTLRDGDSGFSVMGNIRNGTASIGINVLDGEVLVSTYQGCSKTSQGNTIYDRVRNNGSKCSMVEGCTNGAHGTTPLCTFHNSGPRRRRCAVIGCTNGARTSRQGLAERCVKHGGGNRCKYDGCWKNAKGSTDYCIVHGGGRRCKFQGCRKVTQVQTDYCIEHGGGRRCRLLGCSVSATYGKDFCSMHRTSLLNDNNSAHEILPAPAPVHPQSENLAEAATSLPISEQDATATTSLSMVDHGSTMFSSIADKFMQPEKEKFLATSDGAKEGTQPGNHEFIVEGDCGREAMQSEREAGVISSMKEQVVATSFLFIKQGAIITSLGEDKSMQSGNQVFVAAVDCAKEDIQSENTTKGAGLPSLTCKCHSVGQLCQRIGCPHIIEDGLDLCLFHGGGHPNGEPGSSTLPCTKSEVSIKHERHSGMRMKGDAVNATGSTQIYNLHAQEEPEGDTQKDENCDFETETVTLSPQDKEKETFQFRKFCSGKEEKQVNNSATECNRQFSILHAKGVRPTLHNGDGGFSVMQNVRDGTASIGISVLGSKGCMVQGCTNGAHGVTPLCIFHNSRSHKRCCAIIGCTTAACEGSQVNTDHCVKHGGGKRCKYEGCGKGAQGSTDYCIGHGGGRRCKFQGCRKSAQGRCDYCIRHGGDRRCKFPGCSASATWGRDLCSMHRKGLLSGNNSDHEMLPAPAPAHQEKKAEPSKRRKSHSVIVERCQKRQNTNDYVNTVVETGEERGRVFVCENKMQKAQQTQRSNSESGLAAGSPSLQLASISPTTVATF